MTPGDLRRPRHVLASLALLLAPAVARAAEGYLLPVVPGAEGGMLELNVTMVVQAINYIVFIWLMNLVVYRPVLAHLDRRKELVAEAEQEAEKAAEEVRRAEAERERRLEEAYTEASRERSKIKAAAVDEYQAKIHAARAEADRTVQEARDRFQEEAAEAEKELEPQVAEFAAAIRAKLMAEEGGAS